MSDDRQIWMDFLAFCENEREDQIAQLRPLQTGEMRQGNRRTDSGEWVDVTDGEIATLKRTITSLDGLIVQTRQRLRDG